MLMSTYFIFIDCNYCALTHFCAAELNVLMENVLVTDFWVHVINVYIVGSLKHLILQQFDDFWNVMSYLIIWHFNLAGIVYFMNIFSN